MTSSADALVSDKHQVARKTTLVSVAVNSVLVVLQIVIGVIAHSQALIADGIHSLADLVSDFVVLLANRHSGAKPDADHNYGHSRYETVASLFLGALLIAVGIGMLWRAGTRIADLGDIPPVHLSALAVALLVLVSKEGLFRYMLREAQRVRSQMLIANAWHARSDAASSLVVAIGIVGSVAGLKLLDPIAAAIVGFMVARMGWVFGWDALQDLSDRALDEAATADLRALLLATPGVLDVHEMRTRKTGDLALVDAHILVDPFISVSEGHYIAEQARSRVLTDARVLDALIHVDPEDDMHVRSVSNQPARESLIGPLGEAFAAHGVQVEAVTLHYLSTGLAVQVALAAGNDATRFTAADRESIKRRVGASRLDVVNVVSVDTGLAPAREERVSEQANKSANERANESAGAPRKAD
ncbi:cation diffusion facilitator family transporter [Paraburkholderia sp. J12]|uniref:cation diffusion facilitator family transporter n=1 Tax=Paraburkholderia sp. J12 TaxID=2805432 RepID=UPI002ABDE73E|nr:cation diffusion facilitator family transporter [Paraburkholderia sp. J12]